MAERYFATWEKALKACKPGETVSFPGGSMTFGTEKIKFVPKKAGASKEAPAP